MFRIEGLKYYFITGFLAVIFLIAESFTGSASNEIRNYIVFVGIGKYNAKNVIILRKFEQSGQIYYVAVDPQNLKTFFLPSKDIEVTSATWNKVLEDNKNTTYVKAILAAQKQSASMQNSGIIHGYSKLKGVSLTIDLCPSRKPMDKEIFTKLITEFAEREKPIPVAVSITGRFLSNHKNDFNYLVKLVESGDISITWINHSYSHRYNPRLPLENNFLLEPRTDLNYEILETERTLLQKGVMFSVFFRFPGLISKKEIVDKVTTYGLIPVGSDAWLAKGEPVQDGSILLIHGNGNEPLGVKKFIGLLNQKKSLVAGKQWQMYDLRESIESEFQN